MKGDWCYELTDSKEKIHSDQVSISFLSLLTDFSTSYGNDTSTTSLSQGDQKLKGQNAQIWKTTE